MCESISSHCRRSVKFTDAPPEVLQFSYNQPNWGVIPLSSSASTSSISALKKALDEERQKPTLIGKNRSVALRRSVKLNADAVQNWSLNRKKLLSQECRSQRILNKGLSKKCNEAFSLETVESKSTLRSANFSKLFSHSCDSLALSNARFSQAGFEKVMNERSNNCSTIAKEADSKTILINKGNSGELKSGIIRTKLRAASKLANRGARYSKANSAGDADGRWLSTKSEFEVLNEIESDNNNNDNDLEMARHIAECLEQFNTGLDKVLQARQLLESTQDLPPDDKDKMLRVLNQAIRTGRKRLDINGEQPDSVETYNNNSNNTSGQKQSSTPTNLNSSSEFQTVDPQAFLQRYGNQLVELVLNRAKQN